MASRGVNKVILVGNLGNDPETRHMPNGGAVTNLTLATSESWKDKNTGEQREKTEWHRIIGFNRLAEIMGEYLKKGSKIYIEGKLQTRKWQDNEGNDRYTTEIVANEMQMLDSRGEGGQQGQGQQNQQQQNQGGTQQRQNNGQGQQQNSQGQTYNQGFHAPPNNNQGQNNGQGGGFDEYDPDIPFMRINDRLLNTI